MLTRLLEIVFGGPISEELIESEMAKFDSIFDVFDED